MCEYLSLFQRKYMHKIKKSGSKKIICDKNYQKLLWRLLDVVMTVYVIIKFYTLHIALKINLAGVLS